MAENDGIQAVKLSTQATRRLLAQQRESDKASQARIEAAEKRSQQLESQLAAQSRQDAERREADYIASVAADTGSDSKAVKALMQECWNLSGDVQDGSAGHQERYNALLNSRRASLKKAPVDDPTTTPTTAPVVRAPVQPHRSGPPVTEPTTPAKREPETPPNDARRIWSAFARSRIRNAG